MIEIICNKKNNEKTRIIIIEAKLININKLTINNKIIK